MGKGYWTGKKRPDVSEKLKGHVVSEETRKKIGLKSKGRHPTKEFKKGHIPANKGKKFPELSKEKHPNWKGGSAAKYKRWNDSNREKRRFWNRLRRMRRVNAVGVHTLGEWDNLKAQYNWTCPSCKKSEPDIILTEDHIIPLIKGGSNNISNIQPLCRSCNSRKNTKIIKYEN